MEGELSEEEGKRILQQKFYNLMSTYNIQGLNEFLFSNKINFEQDTYVTFIIRIKDKSTHTEIGYIQLNIYNDKLELLNLVRSSEGYKGVITDILKFIILKSIEFNLPLHFKALPHDTYGIMPGKERKNLYAYYNRLGFTRTSHNNSANHIDYITSVDTLKTNLTRWIKDWSTKGGKRSKRTTKKKRNGRTRARR